MSSIIKSSQIVKCDNVDRNDKLRNTVVDKDLVSKAKMEYNIIVDSAKKESEVIIEEANKKADVILANSYKKTKKIFEENREKGYKEGYDNGYRKGYNEGKEISDKLIDEANGIKKEYLNEKAKVLSETEKDIIELVFTICEKVINKKIEEDRETIISLISKGLDSLSPRENLIIRVSKEDYDYVEMSKDRILAMANLVEDISIKIDNKLDLGSCIIEGTKGSVNVSVKNQIKNIQVLMTDLLNGE